jgi:type 1 glutamine amidotransferase
MKKVSFSRLLVLTTGCLSVLAMNMAAAAAEKKVLIVTVTKGFRHSSIPTAEKVLAELGKKSGAFTVDYARVEPNDPQYKGADGKTDQAKVDEAIKAVLAEKMSPAALKNYDAVIFANTTGDLPLPDRQAFIDWIKSGKGFVGMHSAADTYDKTGNSAGYMPYVEMLGAQFQTHHAQAEVDCLNQDPKHPATKDLPASWHVKDEIYLMNDYNPAEVHELLTLDKHPNEKTPGHYPISWCKMYGKGRVFYTSLGHREDVWDPETPARFKRENSQEVSQAYQQHILGGIKWALGLAPGDATPQARK